MQNRVIQESGFRPPVFYEELSICALKNWSGSGEEFEKRKELGGGGKLGVLRKGKRE